MDQREYAWRAAVGIGVPGFVMTFVSTLLQRVRAVDDFFSLTTLIDAVILLVGGLAVGYLAGLILWRVKHKLENE